MAKVNRRELSDDEYSKWLASRFSSSSSSSLSATSSGKPHTRPLPLDVEPLSVDQAASILVNMSVSPRLGPFYSSPSPFSTCEYRAPSSSATFEASTALDTRVEAHTSDRVTRSRPQGLLVDVVPYFDPTLPSPALESSTSACGQSPTSDWSLETPTSISLVLPAILNYEAPASKLDRGANLAHRAVEPSSFSSM